MSAKPVLYYTPTSPPCRSVLLCAAAIGLELELRVLNLKEGEHLKPEFLKLNPHHTVPVLDDNGVIVSDSHIICGYLVDKYSSDQTLYPKDPEQRREVDSLLYFECGHLFPRLRFMVEPVIYFGYDHIADDRVTYMQRAYDGLEHRLASSSGPYMCGKNLTIADLCCVTSVSTSRIFAPIDPEKYTKVSAWMECMSQLPFYEKANKEGLEMGEKFIKQKLIDNKNSKSTAV